MTVHPVHHNLHRAVLLTLILLYLQLWWIGVDAFGVDVDAKVPAPARRHERPKSVAFDASSCDLPSKAPIERWGGVISGSFDRTVTSKHALALLLSSCLCFLVHPEPSFARQNIPVDMPSLLTSVGTTGPDLSSITLESIDDLNLKPATDEKPQIKLAETSSTQSPGKSVERKPILQGLVYFPERAAPQDKASSKSVSANLQQMDYYSDVLVLTAVSASQPGSEEVLAGAKFPVSRVRFPLNFQMYRENLLLKKPGVKEAWERIEDTEDVIIRASVCPSDASTFPCENPKKTSQGVAKLITNIPGLKDGQVIRAPASLQLQ